MINRFYTRPVNLRKGEDTMSEMSNALHEVPAQPVEDPPPSQDLAELISESHLKAQESEKGARENSSVNQLEYFGFETHPFSDSVNPEFFYGSSVHETAFKKMSMTIQEDISLGLVHGASGTGKTLMSLMLLKHLNPAEYRTVMVLVTPGMSKTSLLKEILRELIEENDNLPSQTQALIDLLHSRIIDLYSQNRKLVILIDEAHFLSSESLHILRTISNLETPQKKLSTCILFAEDLFLRRLSHPSYESLRNRMYLKVQLLPMGPDETSQYIKFRLLSAGCKEPIFEDEAFMEIYKSTGGVCRDINRICHNSLMEAFLEKKKRIGKELIKNVLA
ncbi:MAG: hypothetical protein AUK29_06645 [Nitrospirae bacterium CG2_30_53_67]|nr:MAG: hypothetical protein AUK29_06645 [Nitrospirae bacterium CG2_30_53_67]